MACTFKFTAVFGGMTRVAVEEVLSVDAGECGRVIVKVVS